MNCEEANNIDLVNYLYSSGYTPAIIESIEYRYLYLLRFETSAAFKSNRNKNISYNHAMGNGSRAINFVIKYLTLNGQSAVQKLDTQVTSRKHRLLLNKTEEKNKLINICHVDCFYEHLFSFRQQKDHQTNAINNVTDTPFHLHENDLIGKGYAVETATNIIAAMKPITDPLLCRYLHQKRANKNIATTYSYEVNFKMENVEEFFNNSGIKNDFENPVSSVDLKLKNVSQNYLKNNNKIDHILNKNFHPKQQSKASKSLTIFG